jgi:hypothetical protein
VGTTPGQLGWSGSIGPDPGQLAATIRCLLRAVPDLGQAGAAAAVIAVTGHARPLRELHDHLAVHPDAVTSGSADQAPPSLIRLTKLLSSQGVPGVKVPACAHCGRTDRALPGCVQGGRICAPCRHKATATSCSACGQVRPVQARTTDGLPLCDRCAGRPRRVCGRCGKTATIGRRATATTPDLCQECNRTHEATCAVCGKTKRCRRTRDGDWICSPCQPTRAPRRICCRCGRRMAARASWPAGPVCPACYEHALNNPGPCASCGRRAVLIGTNPDGQPICGHCAGSKRSYDCPECGQPCRPFAGGRCARRVLTERLHHLLHLATHPELAALAAALSGTDNPRAVIRWLGGEAGRILTDLTTTGQPLTHAGLDALPPSTGGHYLRSLLIATGALPDRDDYLERVAGRIDQLLTGQPAPQAALVRRYAQWDVMVRARRRRSRSARPSSSATSQHLRQKIRLSLDFLTWLDQHTIGLDQLTQADLDHYLTERTTTRPLESFITWLRRQHLIGDVRMPTQPKKAQPTPIPEPERWRLLHRCLHEDDLPLQVRTAAALLLLFGNPVTRTVTLTTSALTHLDGRDYLTLADRPVLLPPALAALLHQLRKRAQPPSTLARAVATTEWLFPGRRPGTHRNGAGFTATLAAHGIDVRPGRTAALMALAEHLPATVLGPLLGLHPYTAATWTNLVQRDWTAYLAARTPTQATTTAT